MVFRDRTYAVLIVSASQQFTETTRALLPPTDYYPVETARNAGAARRALLETAFDIVLIQSPLRDEFGSRLAADVCQSSGAGVLLFVRNEVLDDVYAKVMEDGVMVLGVPTSAQMVSQSLRMLCAARERLRRMEEKQVTVEEKIAEIRMMNRAKWLLIERLQMTEAEAHRCIEKQAMDLRVSRREVAENIVKTYQTT
jgi:response regulator NasT